MFQESVNAWRMCVCVRMYKIECQSGESMMVERASITRKNS